MKKLNPEKVPDKAKVGRVMTLRVMQIANAPFDSRFKEIVLNMLDLYIQACDNGDMGNGPQETLTDDNEPSVTLEAEGATLFDMRLVPEDAFEEPENAPVPRHRPTGETIN